MPREHDLIREQLRITTKSPRPTPRKGVSVQMAVAVNANGEVFAGVQRTEPGALAHLSTETVYVKADARVPFQTVLTVLDALRGKSVVLLTASPSNAPKAKMMPPYGIKVAVSR